MITNVVFHTTETHLKQIEDWLIAERREINEGFYCNWRFISRCYEQKQLCCITLNNEAIGFAAWWDDKPSVRLEIVEVRPDLRRQGFGKILVKECFNYFRKLGFLVVDLECQPPDSEPLWRHLGFRGFPKNSDKSRTNYGNGINLYQPLIKTLEANIQNTDIEVIELWDRELWEAQNLEPTWIWSILFQNNTQKLIEPIIHPCDLNWRLRWRKGATILIDKKVKHFSKNSLSWDKYLVINELSENPNIL